jgi:hypothetical protein
MLRRCWARLGCMAWGASSGTVVMVAHSIHSLCHTQTNTNTRGYTIDELVQIHANIHSELHL